MQSVHLLTNGYEMKMWVINSDIDSSDLSFSFSEIEVSSLRDHISNVYVNMEIEPRGIPTRHLFETKQDAIDFYTKNPIR